MVKYFRFSFVGILLFLGVLFDFASEDDSTKKGLYYDGIEYSNNVTLLDSNGLDLNYSAELVHPGDSYYLNFLVVNDSNVDMKILNVQHPDSDEFISYHLSYEDGSEIKKGDIIQKGEVVALRYNVSYDKVILEDDYIFDSSFHIQYEQVL